MDLFKRCLQKAGEWTILLIVLSIFLVVCLQVLSRSLPGHSIPWTLEVGEILLGALIWFGIFVGIFTNSHISFDLIISKFPKKIRKFFEIINVFIFIVYLGLIAYVIIPTLQFHLKVGTQTVILGINIFWVRLPIFIGCILGVLSLLIILIKTLRNEAETYEKFID